MLISFYAAPRITERFYPVLLRNLLVWRKLAIPSIVGNIAEPLRAALKSLFSVGAIMVVIFALGISRAPSMLLALPLLGIVGVTFASIALVFNALAKGYDFFTYYFTLVLTPMTFLSGVYFPIAQMPQWLQAVAQVLPLTAAVELVRPLMIGEMPTQWLGPLLLLAAYAFGGYYLALVLTRRRFFK